MGFQSEATSILTQGAKSKPIMTTDILQHLRKGEPWDRGVLAATKMVMFQQAGIVQPTPTPNPPYENATSISKITLSYFTSTDCSGTGQGTNPGSSPNPSYTTPDGTPFTISTLSPFTPKTFGMVAASAWNVGNAKLGISNANMANIKSIAVTFKSTNNNTPQACFGTDCGTTNSNRFSFACVPVSCSGGECTSGSGTQSFQLKTTAAIGDPANGGVIACLGGGLNNLVAGSLDSAQAYDPGIQWGDFDTAIGVNAQSDTDGATNTTAIVTALGAGNAAGLCQTYATTVVTGGYNTWFLPAKDQLNCLHTNQVAIGNFDLTNYPYFWSSTEFVGAPPYLAWLQVFDSGDQTFKYKDEPLGVRCVQAFTP
jgi:hypothetical protein